MTAVVLAPLLGPLGPLAPAATAAAAVTPSPTPTFVVPRATSTTGGEALRGTRVLVDLPAGVPAPPRVKAVAWVLADLDSGDVLVAGNAHVRLAPASTLKILTAITVVPRLNPKALYTAVDADAAIDGTKVGLVPRSRYTVDDLLHGLMMGSGNDTANALATLSGGMPATTAAMAEQAARLQACDTVPVNDSGLDAPGQVSSAYDLALLGRAALADPKVARLLVTTAYSFPAAGTTFDATRKRYQIQNHNRLLRNYDGATGVKNGFTDAARGSFVGSATRGGHSYVVSLMRTEGRNWHDAAALLDWAFAVGDRARPVGRLADPLPEGTPASCSGPGTDAGSTAAASGGAAGRPAGSASGRPGAVGAAGQGRHRPADQPLWRNPIGWSVLVVAGSTMAGLLTLVRRRRTHRALGRRRA